MGRRQTQSLLSMIGIEYIGSDLLMFHSPSSGSSQAFFDRLESMATPAGYIAPAVFQSKDKEYIARIKSLAAKALYDPLLQRDLCDRIYELMLEDLRLQKERIRHYGDLL